MFCEKEGVLKYFPDLTGKHLCWSFFLINLQVFNGTYFEENLRTASKKINICLIVKVLFFRRIKLLNRSVNKKIRHVQKFHIRSHVAQEF